MSTVRTKFYTLFWENEHCQNIFLLHKEQLLVKYTFESDLIKTSNYRQWILLSNSLKRKSDLSGISHRIDNRDIDSDHIIEKGIESLVQDAKIKAFYEAYLEKPLKKLEGRLSNKTSQIRFLISLLHALTSEERLLKFLQQHELVPKHVTSFDEAVSLAEEFVASEVKKIVTPQHVANFISTFDNAIKRYENFMYETLLESDSFYTDVLYSRENYKDRLALFDLLFDSGVFVGGKFATHYECVNCLPETFKGTITLNVRPSKTKLKCPNCNKDLFYLVPYKIEDSIFEDICDKDGLLSGALSHLLSTNKINFKRNVSIGKDVEIDIAVLNSENQITDIIEVKMFKTNRPFDTTIATLKEEMGKFIKAREKLLKINLDYANVNFHFVTNTISNQLKATLETTFSEVTKSGRVFINTISDIKTRIEKLG
ncbi:MAG: hypothetical protein KGZ74_12025 [Chitinophagaceae bacterium]|nr:hypothetical protein [Chitinophagaceae bacterium]